MPRLNQRKNDDEIPTYLRLPRTTRTELEACIGHKDIKTLTDAVIEAAKLLANHVKKSSAKPSAKLTQDPS